MTECDTTRPVVLLADDDATSRKLLLAKLSRLPIDIVEAGDGIQAFQVLMSKEVDLLILDLEMPHMDGYQLLGCIRGSARHRHLPVVVLSAKEDRKSLESALGAGATSYLVKPLNWSAFGDHIHHLLEVARALRWYRQDGGIRMVASARELNLHMHCES